MDNDPRHCSEHVHDQAVLNDAASDGICPLRRRLAIHLYEVMELDDGSVVCGRGVQFFQHHVLGASARSYEAESSTEPLSIVLINAFEGRGLEGLQPHESAYALAALICLQRGERGVEGEVMPISETDAVICDVETHDVGQHLWLGVALIPAER